eukprot:30593-Chlamydomonas_euryale.AAC.4
MEGGGVQQHELAIGGCYACPADPKVWVLAWLPFTFRPKGVGPGLASRGLQTQRCGSRPSFPWPADPKVWVVAPA